MGSPTILGDQRPRRLPSGIEVDAKTITGTLVRMPLDPSVLPAAREEFAVQTRRGRATTIAVKPQCGIDVPAPSAV